MHSELWLATGMQKALQLLGQALKPAARNKITETRCRNLAQINKLCGNSAPTPFDS